MNERIQSQPPRPLPTSNQDEHDTANLRKPRSGIPGWVWVMIAVPLLLVVGCVGLGSAGFFYHMFLGVAPQPAQQRPAPAATARVVPAPLPAPQPDER